MKGKVKFFDEQKGYGFIVEESGTDYFVHKSGCLDKIKKDDLVTFELEKGNRGYKCVNVMREKKDSTLSVQNGKHTATSKI